MVDKTSASHLARFARSGTPFGGYLPSSASIFLTPSAASSA
jgi:hypothetical protein